MSKEEVDAKQDLMGIIANGFNDLKKEGWDKEGYEQKTREQKTTHYHHDFEIIERSIPNLSYSYFKCKVCGKVEYSTPEYQKIWDYKKHLKNGACNICAFRLECTGWNEQEEPPCEGYTKKMKNILDESITGEKK